MSKKAGVTDVEVRLCDAFAKHLEENGVKITQKETLAERVSFGLPALDLITGGGVPVGMLTMLWGQEGSGKTTTALYLAREFINEGKRRGERLAVAWIDAERTFDSAYAESLGIDLDHIVLHRPQDGETAEETLEKVVGVAKLSHLSRLDARVGLIVIDSMNALSTARSMEAGMTDKDMGSSAKLWTNFCRQFPAPIDSHNIALVMIAQMRKNLGQMYGNPDTMSGGEALKHMTRLRIKFKASGEKKKGDKVVATILKPVVVKSSVFGAVMKGTAEMEMRRYPHTYIDPVPQLVSVGQELSILTNAKGERAGSGYWFFEGEQLTIGFDKVVEHVRQSPELLQLLAIRVREAIQGIVHRGEGLPVLTADGPDAEDDFLSNGESAEGD